MTDDDNRDGRRYVIVGGYGHVGRRLAELLAPTHDVVVAGRRGDEAARLARTLGARSATVDATTGTGLGDVVRPGDVVVNASSDQPTAALLQATVRLGGDYADLSADAASLTAMIGFHDAVRDAGCRALVGIGLSPGATNVLARAALGWRPDADEVDTVVVLSIADDFGPAAVEWMLRAFAPADPSIAAEVHPFGRSLRLDVPGVGPVLAHEFPFPEQRFLPRTLGVARSTSWCAFHPRWASRLIGVLGRRRLLARVLARPSVAWRLGRLAGRLPARRTPGLVGAAGLATDGRGESTMVSLAARSESETTARCAVALLDVWPTDASAHGVHLPESVIAPDTFAARLAEDGLAVTTGGGRRSTDRG